MRIKTAIAALVLVAGCASPASIAPPIAESPTTTTATADTPTTIVNTATTIGTLVVAAPYTAQAYRRAYFGDDWIDADHDCHDTRAEVLMAESTKPVTFNPNGCTVATGHWTDPWSGFQSDSAADFQIDHLVALANAWTSGAWAWSDDERLAYANDVDDGDHLVVEQGALNEAKSDKTPDQWKPPLRSSWCRYATSWTAVKIRWHLTVTRSEESALSAMIATCPPA